MSGGTHLELVERERLAALKAEGLSLRAIARALGRAASTVSRELRRNALPKGGYLPVHAEGCYRERRQRPAVLERDERLGRFVRERLLEGWTPEQIAGWLKRGEERGLGRVSVETIYAFLHRPGQRGEKLWQLLPRKGRLTDPPPGFTDEFPQVLPDGSVLFVRTRQTSFKRAEQWYATEHGTLELLGNGMLLPLGDVTYTTNEITGDFGNYYGHYAWSSRIAIKP